MAKIITIPNDNDPVMNAERTRIPPWAAVNAWVYTGYNDEPDHIAQIASAAAGQPMEILDFDCHGAPTVFDHTSLASVAQFAQALSQSTGFSANTAIYLDACNTGLTSDFGGPIAQSLANAAGCSVYGTKGYMTGTFAENNEQCYASVSGLPPYPGAQDAAGRNVWITFQPTRANGTKSMHMASSITIKATDDTRGAESHTPILRLLEESLRGEPVDFPSLRMAPDVTINYIRTSGDVFIIDVYANGSLLRDRITGRAWRVLNAEGLRTAIKQALL